MNNNDKRKIKLFKTAYPEQSEFMSDQEILNEIKWIKNNYKKLNNIFEKSIKIYKKEIKKMEE